MISHREIMYGTTISKPEYIANCPGPQDNSQMAILTPVHVLISLVGIGSGIVVLLGLLNAKRVDGWTALFLATTAATSATGFLFPFHGFTPADNLGVISLIDLAIAVLARYIFHLAGAWQKVYVVTATIALYLNCFVLVVQLFRKVPALEALAPTQSEPPFAVAQLVLLVVFVVLGIMAVRKFRPGSA